MASFCFESINWSPYFGQSSTSVFALVEAASEAGFSWISFDEPLLKGAQRDSISLAELEKAVEGARLKTLAVHSLGISGSTEVDMAAAEQLLLAAMELGAPYLHCGVTGEVDSELRKSVKRIATRARECGVALAIEFLPFLPVASIADTRAIIEACEDDGPGMVVDSWHFFHGPDSWEELQSLKPSEIAYVQFDDHPALESRDILAETTMRRVLPGLGEFDLDRFAQVFHEMGWQGIVGLELLSEESRNRPPGEVALELMRSSQPYWDGDGDRNGDGNGHGNG